MKICSKCEVSKDYSLFYKSKNTEDGHYQYCIECTVAYRNKNKEKIKIQTQKRKEQTSSIYEFDCVYCLVPFKSFRSNSLCCSKICYSTYYGSTQNGKESKRVYNLSKVRTLTHRFNSSKSKAKLKGMCWEIDFESYKLLQENNCFYCSDTLLNKTSIGLDRIDNSRGYELLNVLPCCGDCNKIRQDKLTVYEMIHVSSCLKRLRSGKKPY